MKKVIIAHQSSIPHYRVPFYNAIERIKPDTWEFEVVFDYSEATEKRFFKEEINPNIFEFKTLNVHTLMFNVLGKRICYQTFWRVAKNYDLIVVEQAVNNLTYPLCQLHQMGGTKFAYWGSGRDRNTPAPSAFKVFLENLKTFLSAKADGFFAYTQGVKSYMQQKGLDGSKVFVLNNTVDIIENRNFYKKYKFQRDAVKESMGLCGKKVLLFVGRFTRVKRINFLLEAFSSLSSRNPDFHLLLVGSGGEPYLLNENTENITYFGALSSVHDLDKMAQIYTASDMFVFPGLVGLAPLTALCYDLPIITVFSNDHKPEFEYLTAKNSIVLDNSTTPKLFADTIEDLFYDRFDELLALKENAWHSISHLTIDNMAKNFVEGVNSILALR